MNEATTTLTRADGHRQFYAQGKMNAIHKRLNPDDSVFVKRGLSPRPDPSWLRAQGALLNRIHASLAGPDAQAHRDHFAVEVLKRIEDDNRGVYLTPIVKGFSLEDYIDDPASYASRFPVQDLDSMKRQLTDAMSWLSDKGFVHGDVKLANIMYDEDHRRLVLIDFELARPATAEGLERDLVNLEYAFDDIG
jgi:serine/threonine protein kinase